MSPPAADSRGMEGRCRAKRKSHMHQSRPLQPREPDSRAPHLRVMAAAGLRARGLEAPDLIRAPIYWMPLPGPHRPSAQGIVRSQLPLRDSSGMAWRGVTGFPFEPTPGGRHRWRTQDMVFCAGLSIRAGTQAEPPRLPPGYLYLGGVAQLDMKPAAFADLDAPTGQRPR